MTLWPGGPHPGDAPAAAAPASAAPGAVEPAAAADDEPAAGAPALVVFVDDAQLRCLRVLRRGFRHCFVAVRLMQGWIVYDPLSHRTDLCFVDGLEADELARWYQDFGLLVVATRVRPAPLRPAPVRLFTCVEAVKRVLGIHAPWTLTPWQLYRLLRPVGENKTTTLDKAAVEEYKPINERHTCVFRLPQ